jgi:hypothetical protein
MKDPIPNKHDCKYLEFFVLLGSVQLERTRAEIVDLHVNFLLADMYEKLSHFFFFIVPFSFYIFSFTSGHKQTA